MLIDLSGEVNGIQLSFAIKLDFCIYKTNVSAQKINGGKLGTYRKIITLFQVDDKDKKFRFFTKSFLFFDISINVVFEMFFLILSNIEINFNNWDLK